MSFFCGRPRNPSEEREKKKNDKIDQQLKKDKKVFNSTIKLMLAGAGESGKSVCCPNITIFHIHSFCNSFSIQFNLDYCKTNENYSRIEFY